MSEEGACPGSTPPPDGTGQPEWELFVRETGDDPLRHIGSVTAPTSETAHEQATVLFAEPPRDIWVCRRESMDHFSTYTLGESGCSEDANE